jgi:hypothetical protein
MQAIHHTQQVTTGAHPVTGTTAPRPAVGAVGGIVFSALFLAIYVAIVAAVAMG